MNVMHRFCNSEQLHFFATCLQSFYLDGVIEDISKLLADGTPSADDILSEARQIQFQLNITADYKFYIVLCGLFNPKHNIVKHWSKYEKVFDKLVKEDEKGSIHLFQAIILFFIKKYPEQKKLAGTFCKVLYDRKVFTDEFLNSWHSGEIKLDKNTKLYDRKADKAFKAEVAPFIEWLQYGEEDDGEEEEKEEAEEQ